MWDIKNKCYPTWNSDFHTVNLPKQCTSFHFSLFFKYGCIATSNKQRITLSFLSNIEKGERRRKQWKVKTSTLFRSFEMWDIKNKCYPTWNSDFHTVNLPKQCTSFHFSLFFKYGGIVTIILTVSILQRIVEENSEKWKLVHYLGHLKCEILKINVTLLEIPISIQ